MILHILNGLLLMGLWLGVQWGWIGLSEQGASPWEWYFPPFLATGMVALMYGLARILPRWPHLLNIPRKDEVMALSPEGRAPVMDEANRLLYASGTFLLVLFGVVQHAVYLDLLGQESTGVTVGILILAIAGGPAFTGVFLIRIMRAVRRALDGED